ncbi:unnamed protein product [Polarella glacialis]|uniref:Phosphate transporter n=1 Tax=Polarella glacialis TaxID=89957 RepID=A0A813IAL7_POLGL|nr:unnamed protein product [Polarella glacialis]
MAAARHRHFSLVALLVSSPVAAHMATTRLPMLGFTGIIAGLLVAWGIGANYVANNSANSVGSKARILRQAVAVPTVYEFALILRQAVAIPTVYELVGCLSTAASIADTEYSSFGPKVLILLLLADHLDSKAIFRSGYLCFGSRTSLPGSSWPGASVKLLANNTATSVGSKALILRQAVAIPTVYEFVGCLSTAASVTDTDCSFFGPKFLILLLLADLLGCKAIFRLPMLGFTGIIAGLFMAWGIGANCVANNSATSVGSKALILRQAVAVPTVYEFVGCLRTAASVTATEGDSLNLSKAIFRSGLSLNSTFVSMAAARHCHFSLVALLVSSPVAAHMAVLILLLLADYLDSKAIFRSGLDFVAARGPPGQQDHFEVRSCRDSTFVSMAGARHRHFSLVAALVSSPVAAHMAVTAQLGNVSNYQATYAWIHGHHCRALRGLGGASYVANNSTTSMGSKVLKCAVTSHWCRALHGLGIDANYVANNSATSVGPKVLILLLTFVSMAASRHRLFSLMALLVSSPVAATWKSRHSSATFQITRLLMLGFTGIIARLLIAWGIGENYVANNSATSMGFKAIFRSGLSLNITFVSMAAARHRHFSLVAALVSSPVAAPWQSRHSSATFQITRLLMLGFKGTISGLFLA